MKLTIELEDLDGIEEVLAHIVYQVTEGYTSGYYPTWSLD